MQLFIMLRVRYLHLSRPDPADRAQLSLREIEKSSIAKAGCRTEGLEHQLKGQSVQSSSEEPVKWIWKAIPPSVVMTL